MRPAPVTSYCHCSADAPPTFTTPSCPFKESAHRLLIPAHLAEANPAEALRQYEQFRALLFGKLGILPSIRIEELLSPIRDGRARWSG
jgi:DNA-binding SARP family transcriptional activator